MSAGAVAAPSAREPLGLDRRRHGLRELVGHTPLLEIVFVRHGRRRRIHVKAEHLNMTGSMKDRMALHILARARAEGALAPGAPIVEATSGNTGIAFAAIGRAPEIRELDLNPVKVLGAGEGVTVGDARILAAR